MYNIEPTLDPIMGFMPSQKAKAKRQYLLNLQVSIYILTFALKSSIVIQKILDKSGRTCCMT